MSRKLWRGEKFHPVEIDLTQEERGGKMDINTERKTEKRKKRLRDMHEKLARQWIHL